MSTNISDNDRKIMATAWLCMKTEPQIDYALLAQHMGWKNAKTASACFNPVKKKFMASAAGSIKNGDGGAGGGVAGTPKKGGVKKGKRAASEVEGGEDDDEEVVEPKVKKGKKAKVGKAGEEGNEVEVKAEEGEGEEE